MRARTPRVLLHFSVYALLKSRRLHGPQVAFCKQVACAFAFKGIFSAGDSPLAFITRTLQSHEACACTPLASSWHDYSDEADKGMLTLLRVEPPKNVKSQKRVKHMVLWGMLTLPMQVITPDVLQLLRRVVLYVHLFLDQSSLSLNIADLASHKIS
eukprot:4431153-Amphidinium_carterae.1